MINSGVVTVIGPQDTHFFYIYPLINTISSTISMTLFQITTDVLPIHIMKTSNKAVSLERIARGTIAHSAFSMNRP